MNKIFYYKVKQYKVYRFQQMRKLYMIINLINAIILKIFIKKLIDNKYFVMSNKLVKLTLIHHHLNVKIYVYYIIKYRD